MLAVDCSNTESSAFSCTALAITINRSSDGAQWAGIRATDSTLSVIPYCWIGDLDMARRDREEEMRLGKTLLGR
jgi:hypothetical protein